MCICEVGGSSGGSIFSPAQIAAMATDRATRATLLHASALAAIGQAFDSRACRALKRKAFCALVKASAMFVAEFKGIDEHDDPNELEVGIARRYLFFEVFRRARSILSLAPEVDYLPDVLWTIERGEHLGKALVNLAILTIGTEFSYTEVERTLIDLAGLATAICEWQMEMTGEGPPNWSSDSAGSRADRLAMFLFDAAEAVAIERQSRFRAE